MVPGAELIGFAKQLLRKMLANAPVALSLTMQAVDVGLSCGLTEGLHYEATAFGLSAATKDMQEGVAAFLGKRVPNFEGK